MSKGNTMETKLMHVTPEQARQWLKRNVSNRPIRPSVVDSYKRAFQRGEYRTTHQGIAFDANGNLLDGQHRLLALSEMPDAFSAAMLVSKGLAPEAFTAIDLGLRRTLGDVLNVNQGLAAVGRFLAYTMEMQRGNISPAFAAPYVRAVTPSFERLTEYCPTVTKTWGSSAIRSAAILRMMGNADPDYILLSYHALNHADYSSMSPIVQSLHKQQVLGTMSARNIDMFLRAYKAFDSKNQRVVRIQINDVAGALVGVREAIARDVLGEGDQQQTSLIHNRTPKQTARA